MSCEREDLTFIEKEIRWYKRSLAAWTSFVQGDREFYHRKLRHLLDVRDAAKGQTKLGEIL